MSHLFSAFILGTQRKHQYDTYFGKIHWLAHEIMSVYIFAIFSNDRGSHFGGQFVKKN